MDEGGQEADHGVPPQNGRPSGCGGSGRRSYRGVALSTRGFGSMRDTVNIWRNCAPIPANTLAGDGRTLRSSATIVSPQSPVNGQSSSMLHRLSDKSGVDQAVHDPSCQVEVLDRLTRGVVGQLGLVDTGHQQVVED